VLKHVEARRETTARLTTMPKTLNRIFEVGLISDTHGLLRPQALAALAGCDYLVHAGDIGEARILDELARIAPVTAVRGNNDHGPWAKAVPDSAVLEVGGVTIYALHDLGELDLDPAAAGFQVVVTGHSHKPAQQMRGGVLYINPGSAGPRRFTLPVAVARLQVSAGRVTPRLLELAV
jgi:putative phosphoesterase